MLSRTILCCFRDSNIVSNCNAFILPFSHKSYGSDSDDSDIEQSIDLEKLPPLEPGPGEHRLQYTYCLWFSKKVLHRPPNVTPIKAMEVCDHFPN